MSFTYLREMPNSKTVLASIPLSASLRKIKKQRDQEIISVYTGDSDKFLIIIGPCSADNEDAVCEYVSRLAGLQEKVKEKFHFFLH